MDYCPCGSKMAYEKCCARLHDNTTKATTALELMQARYSAFVKNKIDFIESTHTEETEDFSKEEASEWALNSKWLGLEIISKDKGEAADSIGTVEFKAFYSDKKGTQYVHHEKAFFVKNEESWLYQKGETPEVSNSPYVRAQPKQKRNDPCACGSGKKYKKCCALA